MSIHPLPFAALVASLILVGCSDGSGSSGSTPAPQDPLAAYKNQTIQWHDCSAYFSPNDPDPDQALNFEIATQLGQRLQCADIQAPLDYAHPDQARISLALMRVQATDSPETKPNLFFNPGGPGGDGQILAARYAYILDNGSDATPLGQKYQALSQAYNFVGFSPRGVGGSTRQICAGNELIYPTDPTRWGNTPENIQRLTNKARYTATNCQKTTTADFINTEATARDMDLMRHLLGDAQLHYFGISYGTWLGFWYAGIFPDRIGPMVLDSNMDFSQPMADASTLFKQGQTHTFLDFIAPYIARHDNILGMGSTADQVITQVRSLGHETTVALQGLDIPFRAEPSGIPAYIAALKLMLSTQDLLDQGLPLNDIRQALMAMPPIADPDIDAQFRQMINPTIQLIARHRDPAYYSTAQFFALDNDDSVWNTVVCNDEAMPAGQDQAYWTQTGLDLAAGLPIISNSLIEQPCLSWKRPDAITKPSIDSLKTAPLLMLQSQYDVPTPLVGAMQTFDQLPATKMVQVTQEGTHGLMIYKTACVDLVVMDYLLGTPPAERLTICPGTPLALDQQQANQSQKPQVAPAHFRNPALVEDLIQQMRRSIR